MRSFLKRTVRTVIVLTLPAFTAGCHFSPADIHPYRVKSHATTSTSGTQQLIIKFKPGTIACNPAGIAHLSTVTRVSLKFIRQMSGHACVVMQFATAAEDIAKEQMILKKHADIEWLEPDAVMKAL
jgi:hypothetical protein